MKTIIDANKETKEIAHTIKGYSVWCTKHAAKAPQNINYYIRDIIENAQLIAFFVTASSNTNDVAREAFWDMYVRSADFYYDDSIYIEYADSSTVKVSMPNKSIK